jgi:hypothetical protein
LRNHYIFYSVHLWKKNWFSSVITFSVSLRGLRWEKQLLSKLTIFALIFATFWKSLFQKIEISSLLTIHQRSMYLWYVI